MCDGENRFEPAFVERMSVLLDDILLIILQFSGMVGDHYFWVYF